MSSHNLVQELVQEMGPYNPALNAQPGMPMGMMSQGQMQQIPQGPMYPQQMQQVPMQQMPQGQMPQGPMHMSQGPQGPLGQQGPLGPQGSREDYISDDQMQEMMDLENFGMDGSHKPLTDRAMDRGREALFLAIMFVVLSLPAVTQVMQRLVPQLSGSIYYLLGAKGLLLGLAFFLAKNFELI